MVPIIGLILYPSNSNFDNNTNDTLQSDVADDFTTSSSSSHFTNSPFTNSSSYYDDDYSSPTTPKNHHLTFLYVLVFGCALSRAGLWIFDLSITQMGQEGIAEKERLSSHSFIWIGFDVFSFIRGTINGVQQILMAFFELSSYVASLIWNKPSQFMVLATISVGAVTMAALLFTQFTFSSPSSSFYSTLQDRHNHQISDDEGSPQFLIFTSDEEEDEEGNDSGYDSTSSNSYSKTKLFGYKTTSSSKNHFIKSDGRNGHKKQKKKGFHYDYQEDEQII